MGLNHLKIHKGVTFAPQTAAPSSPANGDIYYDDTLNKFRKYENGVWSDLDTTGGSAGSGLLLGDNSDFESTVGDWVAYADAAGTVPVDGTGGSATTTVTRTTSAPLAKTGSLLITKDAADRQGEGGSVTVDVDPKFRSQPVALSFSYEASSLFEHGDPSDPVGSPSDISVFFYDVTNSKLLVPTTPGIFGGGFYSSTIQIPSNTASIRVILHIVTTNTSAWTFKADDFQFDLAPNSFADGVINDSATVTGFTSRSGNNVLFATTETTPTKGLITIDTVSSFTKLIANAEINATISAGAPHATAAATQIHIRIKDSSDVTRFSVPMTRVNSNAFGHGGAITVKMNVGDYVVVESAINLTNNTNAHISMTAQSVSTGYSHVAQIGLNAKVVMRATKNGGTMLADITTALWTTVDKDTNGAFNATTGIYTVKNPGDYYVSANTAITVASTSFISILKNGTVIQVGSHDQSASIDNCSVLIADCKYGDTITMYTSVGVTASSQDNGTSLSIFKIGSEQQPYAPRIVILRDEKSGTTTGGSFSSGAWRTRTLNAADGDLSFHSLSANQFTLQPGVYNIEAFCPANTSGGVNLSGHKARIQDITNVATVREGQNAYAQAGFGSTTFNTNAFVKKIGLVVTTTTTFEIQHRCEITAGSGLGRSNNFTSLQVYTEVEITKVL